VAVAAAALSSDSTATNSSEVAACQHHGQPACQQTHAASSSSSMERVGSNTSFTRSSIAKQLSVLFDEGGLDGGSSAQNLTLLSESDADADRASASHTALDIGSRSYSTSEGGTSSLDLGEDHTHHMLSVGPKGEEGALPPVPRSMRYDELAFPPLGGGRGPLEGGLEGSLRINVDVGPSGALADTLADQLAAVCCSPPRHAIGGGSPWRGSSPTREMGQRRAWPQ